jgi:hypothetical protein
VISRPSIAIISLASAVMAVSASMVSSNGATCLIPFPAITPNSAAWPRSELVSCVRWPIKVSRTFITIPWACCSADFTRTKRIPGRPAASQIASASLRSFLARFTKGFTYCGGIRRTL